MWMRLTVSRSSTYVDVVLHEIMERYHPGESDPYIRVLQAAHLDEDKYFGQLVSDDLIQIIQDIRTAHKGDSETAPVNCVAQKLKVDIEEVINFKGSDQDGRLSFTLSAWGSTTRN